jgi:hypothetical protein
MDPFVSSLMAAATVVTVLLGAWFAVEKFVRPLVKALKVLTDKTSKFLDDWNGTPEEPGRGRVPGVMERLNRIDGELSHNGGKSIKDTVNRIEERLVEGDKKFDELYSRVQKLEEKSKD